ncbi:MAG: thioredoxin domain-containing protein [Novosphingobium sp.]|nr:thioredoxin domain-containing protein [Novosphingobium sp.]
MTRFTFRRFALGMIAVPLALGLAACGKSGENGEKLSGDPIETIAPPEGESWTDVVSKTEEGGYQMGNPDAPIKLVEYGALSCSHCADFSEEASAEITENFVASGRVSYELRHFILNPYDIAATLLATCGTTEAVIPLSEQFWAWQPAMFEHVQNAAPEQMRLAENQPPEQRFVTLASISGMDEFFASRGIAADQAAACLADSNKATELVTRTQKASEEHDITGTPTFLINGQKQDINKWSEVKAKLETLGAR